ncbi:transglutaminase-like domain-containing protein [Sunxiuqinia sp. A32]|uniref:transglutaminase-like domain-containing protein n=1 Tax=Sunxiuqinia sp. A32 TaxID=3461496 RepID=UPI00404646D8
MKSDKLNALLALLDDPDPAVFELVEKEILEEDPIIINQLEQVWETSLDELIQSRIENLIQQIQYNDTKIKIQSWAGQKQVDLFEGFFLLTRYQYPDLKLKTIKNKIRKISSDVWLEISNKLTSLEKITVLNHVFYDAYKFSINLSNVLSPQNCYLNQVLETKKGNSISIAIVYSLIARELGFPLYFIDFPKNPLLAYVDEDIAKKAHGKDYSSPVLFYINPSNKGAIIGRRELERFANKHEQNRKDNIYEPCEDRVIVKKLLENLVESYRVIGYEDKVTDLSKFLQLL